MPAATSIFRNPAAPGFWVVWVFEGVALLPDFWEKFIGWLLAGVFAYFSLLLVCSQELAHISQILVKYSQSSGSAWYCTIALWISSAETFACSDFE
jgi:hypothetical protein